MGLEMIDSISSSSKINCETVAATWAASSFSTSNSTFPVMSSIRAFLKFLGSGPGYAHSSSSGVLTPNTGLILGIFSLVSHPKYSANFSCASSQSSSVMDKITCQPSPFDILRNSIKYAVKLSIPPFMTPNVSSLSASYVSSNSTSPNSC